MSETSENPKSFKHLLTYCELPKDDIENSTLALAYKAGLTQLDAEYKKLFIQLSEFERTSAELMNKFDIMDEIKRFQANLRLIDTRRHVLFEKLREIGETGIVFVDPDILESQAKIWQKENK